MTAGDDDRICDPEHGVEVLRRWFSDRGTTAVEFRENANPVNDPYDDYLIRYEAVFEPVSLECALLEVWFADDGGVALGLEWRGRVAARLGVRNPPSRMRLAGGHEPHALAVDGLLAILNTIAAGDFSLLARVLPWRGLGGIRTMVSSESCQHLSQRGYDCQYWLRCSNQPAFLLLSRTLDYDAWY